MDNPEIHATLGTQDTEQRQKQTQKNPQKIKQMNNKDPTKKKWGEPRCL